MILFMPTQVPAAPTALIAPLPVPLGRVMSPSFQSAAEYGHLPALCASWTLGNIATFSLYNIQPQGERQIWAKYDFKKK